jgi:hypothetical protein
VADPVEEVAGRLYSLPLEDFTRERDAAARELRKAKERDAAAVVAKLPKPTQAAWAANALAREHRDLVGDLLAAADELRDAQEAAVAGRGAEPLREAAAAERAAVDALMAEARRLQPGGRKPSEATLEKLRATLEAVATDDDVRAALEAGRVVEDAEGGGAWGLLAGADVPAAKPRKPAKRRPPKPASKQEARERAAAEERLREERERRQRLETELREARAERRSRERELERAEKAADRAAGRLEAALAAAEEAREQADEAKAELDAAGEAASEARDTVARLEEQLD